MIPNTVQSEAETAIAQSDGQPDFRWNLRINRFFWTVGLFLGFLQAWTTRFTIVNDTISYLDIGDNIWHGHWSLAVNGIWNPFFPALLGGFMTLLGPTAYWEYPLVHLVLFLIFVAAFASFAMLMREWTLLRRESGCGKSAPVPDWVWTIIGYTLFLWTAFRMIGVGETNPDMLLAVIFYLACALLVRIRRRGALLSNCSWLGLVLGLGYLTKSIFFPLSVIILLSLYFVSRSGLRRALPVLAASLIFVLVSAPYTIALSRQKGRITFGESGAYNYAVHVNGQPALYWQGRDPNGGYPRHPAQQLLASPAVYGFASPLPGTYPLWYDPSFWYDGVKTRLHRRQQTWSLMQNAERIRDLCFGLLGVPVSGLFILLWASSRKSRFLAEIAGNWFLLAPALAAIALYSVVWVENRYLAPFLVIVFVALFLSVDLGDALFARRLFPAVAALLLSAFVASVISHPTGFIAPLDPLVLRGFSFSQSLQRLEPPDNSYQTAIADLDRIGVHRGERIASLDCALYGVSMFARLARLKIVAEMDHLPTTSGPIVNSYWDADTSSQAHVLEAFRKAGAQAVISEQSPHGEGSAGWRRAGKSRFYVYVLD